MERYHYMLIHINNKLYNFLEHYLTLFAKHLQYTHFKHFYIY